MIYYKKGKMLLMRTQEFSTSWKKNYVNVTTCTYYVLSAITWSMLVKLEKEKLVYRWWKSWWTQYVVTKCWKENHKCYLEQNLSQSSYTDEDRTHNFSMGIPTP